MVAVTLTTAGLLTTCLVVTALAEQSSAVLFFPLLQETLNQMRMVNTIQLLLCIGNFRVDKPDDYIVADSD